jgi:SAM-dependent methyltransferase
VAAIVVSAFSVLRKWLLDPLFVNVCSYPPVRNYLAPEWKDVPYTFEYSHTGAGLSPVDEACRLRRVARREKAARMLFVGVQEGEELLPWLTSRTVKEVVAIDIKAFHSDWKRLQETANSIGVKLDFVVCDAQRFPFGRLGTFDLIYSQGLLEHIVDVDCFFQGCSRLLKRHGLFFVYFGPLWHSYGGSCHLGMLGYDHLMVPWAEYLEAARIALETVFSPVTVGDSLLRMMEEMS